MAVSFLRLRGGTEQLEQDVDGGRLREVVIEARFPGAWSLP
jgi:hypothetical protein